MKNFKKTWTAVSLVALSCVCAGAQAQSNEKPFRFVVGAGLTGGGDKLASVQYTDGSSESIRAGALVHVFVGGEYRFTPSVSAQVNVGYHVSDSSAASNGSIKFSRVPVEVLGHYALNNQWRVGGGLRFINSAKLKGSGVLAGSEGFDADTGVVLEGEYMFSRSGGVKLRAVSERYKSKDINDRVSGNHVGVYVTGYF